MHRIDTPTADPTANGVGKPGFRTGIAPGIAPTELDEDWCNAVQEEIANAVEGFGVPLIKGTNTQLLTTITQLLNRKAELAGITQWVDLEVGNGGFAIAASPSDIVVVGQSAGIRHHTGYLMAWNPRTAAAGYASHFRDVCWSSAFSRFVAVGDAKEIQDSPTGQTWTRRNTGGASMMFGCAAGSTAIVAVGSGGIMSTTNGTSWIDRTSAFSGDAVGVAYSPTLNRFCVVGIDDTGMIGKIQYSDDGVVWSLATTIPSSLAFGGVIWSAEHGLFFAWTSGENGKVLKSADGVTWVAASGLVTFPHGFSIVSVVALPAHLAVFSSGQPQYVNLYRIAELDGTPATVVTLSLLYGAVGASGFLRVIRVPPDSGNAFAGRLLATGYQRISASHHLG